MANCIFWPCWQICWQICWQTCWQIWSLSINVFLQICAALPNRHFFPFVRLAAYLVADKYRYKYTHKFNKSLSNYKYKYETLTTPFFIWNLRLVKLVFIVYLYLYLLTTKAVKILWFSICLLVNSNLWIERKTSSCPNVGNSKRAQRIFPLILEGGVVLAR